MGNYVGLVVNDNLAFVSGHGPHGDGVTIRGKVGSDLTLDEGYQAARMVGLAILATMREELGSLDRVEKIVQGARDGQLRARLQPDTRE